jgi:hypothetical protein
MQKGQAYADAEEQTGRYGQHLAFDPARREGGLGRAQDGGLGILDRLARDVDGPLGPQERLEPPQALDLVPTAFTLGQMGGHLLLQERGQFTGLAQGDFRQEVFYFATLHRSTPASETASIGLMRKRPKRSNGKSDFFHFFFCRCG